MVGLLLVALGARTWSTRRRRSFVPRPAPSISPLRACALGSAVTLIDLPTSIPYLGAITLIAKAHIATTSRVALLIAYNVVYVAPLLVVLAIWLLMRTRAHKALGPLRHLVDDVTPVVLTALCLIGGVAIAAHAAILLAR